MLETILYMLLFFFLAIFVILALALLLPIRIMVRGEGNTDDGFRGEGRVMLFAGLLGGGGYYNGEFLRAGAYIGEKRVYSTDASRFAKKKKQKTAAENPEEKPYQDQKSREKPSGTAPPGKKKREPDEKEGDERCEETKTGTPGKLTQKPKKPSFPDKLGKKIHTVRKYKAYAGIVRREIKHLFHIDRFAVRLTLGLDDPARTGQVVGLLYAINGMLPERFAIQPGWDFTRKVYAGEADIKVTFRIWLFWGHLARGYWSFLKYRRAERREYREEFRTQEA